MSAVALRRLTKELVAINKNPVEHISTCPLENNLLEWHYVIEGPPGSVYEGGYYHGVLRFPKEYPYKPPSILMFTKNGRFKQNTRLCLSMSDYHPETWNPMWSVASILSGLMSFMLDTQSTLGSMEASDDVRRQCAKQSLQENLRNPTFRKLFPQYVALAEANKISSLSRKRDESITNNITNDSIENIEENENLQADNNEVLLENGGHQRRKAVWESKITIAILIGLVAILIGIFMKVSSTKTLVN